MLNKKVSFILGALLSGPEITLFFGTSISVFIQRLIITNKPKQINVKIKTFPKQKPNNLKLFLSLIDIPREHAVHKRKSMKAVEMDTFYSFLMLLKVQKFLIFFGQPGIRFLKAISYFLLSK